MANKRNTSKRKESPEDSELINAAALDAAAAFTSTRDVTAFAPERALQLGYVKLGADHPRPKSGKEYEVVSASSEEVATVSYPSTSYRRLNLDLYSFFIDDMPDFLSRNNEGMLKVQVSTKNPQDLDGTTFDASFVTEFRGKDGTYAPTFLFRGVFRNVLLQEWINLKVELFELDTDASVYYQKIKGVIDKVPEIKSLDILKGIPYLNLATQLFDGIITTFGRNPDDHLWGELPLLEVSPTPGGAFLRTGIYVLSEKFNSKKQEIKLEEIRYKDNQIVHAGGTRLPNQLVFGIGLADHPTRP